jgi:hypothetical protein
MIDSHGNPGTGGKVIGVETVLIGKVEMVVCVVEGVLIAEVVSTDVLTTAVVDELVEVELLVVINELEMELEEDVWVLGGLPVLLAVTPPGGSRWSMRLRESGNPDPAKFVPTASPLVLDLNERLVRVA